MFVFANVFANNCLFVFVYCLFARVATGRRVCEHALFANTMEPLPGAAAAAAAADAEVVGAPAAADDNADNANDGHPGHAPLPLGSFGANSPFARLFACLFV